MRRRGPVVVRGGPRVVRRPPVGAALVGAAVGASVANRRNRGAATEAQQQQQEVVVVEEQPAPSPPEQADVVEQILPVMVPRGASSGMRLEVKTPDGQAIQCTVPDGLTEGQVFQVSYVPLPPPPVSVAEVQPAVQPARQERAPALPPAHAPVYLAEVPKAEKKQGCRCEIL